MKKTPIFRFPMKSLAGAAAISLGLVDSADATYPWQLDNYLSQICNPYTTQCAINFWTNAVSIEGEAVEDLAIIRPGMLEWCSPGGGGDPSSCGTFFAAWNYWTLGLAHATHQLCLLTSTECGSGGYGNC